MDVVLALTTTTAGSDLVPEVSAARLPVPIAAAILDQIEVVRLLPGLDEGSPLVPAYAYPMSAAHALGLQVPDDLSLVGYNDIPVVSRLPVPLTTIRVPFPQIAANALDLLREAGNDDPPRELVAAPTLIPRKSATAWAP